MLKKIISIVLMSWKNRRLLTSTLGKVKNIRSKIAILKFTHCQLLGFFLKLWFKEMLFGNITEELTLHVVFWFRSNKSKSLVDMKTTISILLYMTNLTRICCSWCRTNNLRKRWSHMNVSFFKLWTSKSDLHCYLSWSTWKVFWIWLTAV